MKTCQRIVSFNRPQLGQCGVPATWVFKYKYPEHPCSCKNKTCPAHFDAHEGESYFCDVHYEDRNPPAPDNEIPLEEQWTRL